MTEEEIYERLNEVFRDVFDDDTIEVDDLTTADDIDDWDSLEHINLIAAVEKEFGIVELVNTLDMEHYKYNDAFICIDKSITNYN